MSTRIRLAKTEHADFHDQAVEEKKIPDASMKISFPEYHDDGSRELGC